MIEVFNGSKIYVVCVPKHTTGGPELLHQFVSKLNMLGYEAYMYYVGENIEDPVAEQYKKYNVKYVTEIEDKERNIIIVPEVLTMILSNYKNIRKVIWWLSIDNYYFSIEMLKTRLANGKLKAFLGNNLKYFDFNDDNVVNLAQCKYISEHLKKKGIKKVYYLSDYLNREFLKQNLGNDLKNKENIVAYNPKKGLEFTKKLIKAGKHIRWVPIKDMNPEEVIQLLKKSKVYIDFGNHPGKDRIPREAAICKCCVITGRKGSANYYEDVPIDDSFKFQDDESNINVILDRITQCFDNFEIEMEKFHKYRDIIRRSEMEFEEQIVDIFKIS
ncbi:hypothetical protein [Clostridium sp. HBUAS56017]|uniref:hypothetical protein n=1 Tax=Clostridium sp. HBUAS56017 TaxID=2571128 RepID=UPI001177A513|nr:hypothetical protein [Clostridium sp. HBUAS56017]